MCTVLNFPSPSVKWKVRQEQWLIASAETPIEYMERGGVSHFLKGTTELPLCREISGVGVSQRRLVSCIRCLKRLARQISVRLQRL